MHWNYSLPRVILPSAVCYHILISLIMPFNIVSSTSISGKKVCMYYRTMKQFIRLETLFNPVATASRIMRWKKIIPEKPGTKYVATLIKREVFTRSHGLSSLICFCVCMFVFIAALYKLSKRPVFKSLKLIFVCNSLKHTKIMFLQEEDMIPKH